MSIFQYIQTKLRDLRRPPEPEIDHQEEKLRELGWTEHEPEVDDIYSDAPSMKIRIVDDREIKPVVQAQEVWSGPEENITLENMSPETKTLLYEFLRCPTSDYMGLGNLLATYDTESKLKTYLSSRVGLKRAKRRSTYD